MMAPKVPPITTNVGEVLVDVLAKPLALDIGKRVEEPDTVEETWTVWTEMEIPPLRVGTDPLVPS